MLFIFPTHLFIMEKSLFERMGGTYEMRGDYRLPCLALPAEEKRPCPETPLPYVTAEAVTDTDGLLHSVICRRPVKNLNALHKEIEVFQSAQRQ